MSWVVFSVNTSSADLSHFNSLNRSPFHTNLFPVHPISLTPYLSVCLFDSLSALRPEGSDSDSTGTKVNKKHGSIYLYGSLLFSQTAGDKMLNSHNSHLLNYFVNVSYYLATAQNSLATPWNTLATTFIQLKQILNYFKLITLSELI